MREQKLMLGGFALGAGLVAVLGLHWLAIGLPVAAIGGWLIASARRNGDASRG